MPVPKGGSAAPVAETETIVQEPQRELIELLQGQGLNEEQAIDLVSRFDDVRIRRQVQWLSLRRARNPVGLLIAAIEDDYAAPPVLWQRSALSPEVATEDAAPNEHSESASLLATDLNTNEPNAVIELPLPPS